VANLANAISVQGFENCTAEARRRGEGGVENNLCELCVSVVNSFSQQSRKTLKYGSGEKGARGLRTPAEILSGAREI
jgi:hypothetical protein